MRATEIELPGIGEPETLKVRTRELSDPGAGQALVRVEASGVSFAEQQMRRGKYYDQPKFPFVPGYDLVGVVEQLGGDGAGEQPGIGVGQRVAALTKTGGWADVPDTDRPADTPTQSRPRHPGGVCPWEQHSPDRSRGCCFATSGSVARAIFRSPIPAKRELAGRLAQRA